MGSADTEPLSKRSSPDESNSSNQSSTSFTLIRPSMPTTKPPWPTTVLNLPLKSMLSSALSKDKLTSLSPNSRKNTDAITSASSLLDVTASTERAHQDHAHSHHHQNTHTRWSVSVLSRSTGTVPNTHVSEPALLRKRPAVSITKATSMKSEPRLPDTSLHSMPRSVNGKPKSQNGNQLPMPVLKKRSPVCFHGATAEPNQLKPKSKLSDKSSEPKLKPGSTKPNNDSSTKSLLLKPESPPASTAGRSEPSSTSTRSTNNSSAVLTTRTPRSPATPLVLKPERPNNELSSSNG